MRQLERLSLGHLDAVLRAIVGQHAGPTGASGLEFADYRPYRPGDELRRIDWNVYARLLEPFVKTAPSEVRVGLALLVDASRSMDAGAPPKLRYAQRVAAMLGAVALLRFDTVEICMLADGGAEPVATLAAPQLVNALVAELDRLPRGERTDLARSVRAYRRIEAEVNMAILITDGLVAPDNAAEALRELSLGAESTAIVHVVDPDEQETPLGGPVELRDRETGERMTLDVTEPIRELQDSRFDQIAERLAAAAGAHGVRYVRASTRVAPIDLLFDAARAADVVRSDA